MKIVRTTMITIEPGNFSSLLREIYDLEENQIKSFFAELEHAKNVLHPIDFFQHVLVNSRFNFLWQKENAEYLQYIWQRVWKEIDEGYHVGLGDHIAFPDEIKCAFEKASGDTFQHKEHLISVVKSKVFITFMNRCRGVAMEMFDDHQ